MEKEKPSKNQRIYSIATFIVFVAILMISSFVRPDTNPAYPTGVAIGFILLIIILLLLALRFAERVAAKKFVSMDYLLISSLMTVIGESMMLLLSTFLFVMGVMLALNLNFHLEGTIQTIGYVLTSIFTHVTYKRMKPGIFAIIAVALFLAGILFYQSNDLFAISSAISAFFFSSFIYWVMKVKIPSEINQR
jgi:hypothetical protein